MAYPTNRQFVLTTTEANQTKAIQLFQAGELRRITVVREGTGAIDMKILNRDLTGTEFSVVLSQLSEEEAKYYGASVAPSGDELESLVAIKSVSSLPYMVGDKLTVTATGTPYDAIVVLVVAISADKKFAIIDVTEEGIASGTVALTVPAADESRYLIDQITGTDDAQVDYAGGQLFRNNDVPQQPVDFLKHRQLYLRFADTGTYMVTIEAVEQTV